MTSGPAIDTLNTYPSVQLFLDRARAARADFQLTEGNAAVVAELCDRLDGLPLALELAAARVAVLSPEQILVRLEARFELLVSRQRDLPLRHRTLRAAILTSYQVLTPELQRFFARLSVFRGGWTIEAAAAVCADYGVRELAPALPSTGETEAIPVSGTSQSGGKPPHAKVCPDTALDALEALTQLREYSLIQVEGISEEEPRFRLLETLREFGAEHLDEEEARELAERHAAYYLELAETVVPRLSNARQPDWPERLERERDNLRAALAWCREESAALPDGEIAHAGLRLADALVEYWVRRGYVAEGLQWLEGALERGKGLPVTLRASAFYGAATLAEKLGDPEQVRPFLIALAQSLEDLAALALREGQAERAIRLLGANEALRETLEARPPVARIRDYERVVAESRAALGEAAFASARAAGRALSLDQAIAFALEADGPLPADSKEDGTRRANISS